jgi:hypothetical protein
LFKLLEPSISFTTVAGVHPVLYLLPAVAAFSPALPQGRPWARFI